MSRVGYHWLPLLIVMAGGLMLAYNAESVPPGGKPLDGTVMLGTAPNGRTVPLLVDMSGHLSTATTLSDGGIAGGPSTPVIEVTPFCNDDRETRPDGGLDFCKTYPVFTVIEFSPGETSMNWRTTPLPDAGFAATPSDTMLVSGQFYKAFLTTKAMMADAGVSVCVHLKAADNAAGWVTCTQ